jgi:hypothetical protein
MAFGFVYTPGTGGRGSAVDETAALLKLPCFRIAEDTFNDTYAIPRTIKALIGATPVGYSQVREAPRRAALAETILKTELLTKPAWA